MRRFFNFFVKTKLTATQKVENFLFHYKYEHEASLTRDELLRHLRKYPRNPFTEIFICQVSSLNDSEKNAGTITVGRWKREGYLTQVNGLPNTDTNPAANPDSGKYLEHPEAEGILQLPALPAGAIAPIAAGKLGCAALHPRRAWGVDRRSPE